jgi:hypothetical protein
MVYLLLLFRLRMRSKRDDRPAPWVGMVETWMARPPRGEALTKEQSACVRAWTAWTRTWTEPALVSSFHAASAGFTIGLLAAVYFRGLFTGYLAAWESTWLDAGGIHLILGHLLGPASFVTGIPLPSSVESWSMLQRTSSQSGVTAGPWIHLYAATLALWVVLPRVILSVSAGLRARHMRSSPPPWSCDEPYVMRLLSLARQDGDIGIAVLPFDLKSPAQWRSGLYLDKIERLVREAWGLDARACVLPSADYGTEESAWDAPWADAETCGGALLVFDIHATPEDEVHGLVVDAVLARFSNKRGGVAVAVECARFPAGRLHDRLGLWRQFAQKRNCPLLPIDQGVPIGHDSHASSHIVRNA